MEIDERTTLEIETQQAVELARLVFLAVMIIVEVGLIIGAAIWL